MQSFIVLGIIPGTTIQLTFNFWLFLAVLLAVSPLMRATWRRRSGLDELLAAIRISRLIARYQLPV